MADPQVDFSLVEFRTANLIRYENADDDRIHLHVIATQRYFEEVEGREDRWVNWNRMPNFEGATVREMRQGPDHISFIALMIYAAQERGFDTIDPRAWYENISKMLGADINHETVLRAVLDTKLYLEAAPVVMSLLVQLGLDMSRTRIEGENGLHYLVGEVLYAAIFLQENTDEEEEAYLHLAYELMLWDYRKHHSATPSNLDRLLEEHTEDMMGRRETEDGVDTYTRAALVMNRVLRSENVMRFRSVYRKSALTDYAIIVSPVGERAARYLDLDVNQPHFSREECIAARVAYAHPHHVVESYLNEMRHTLNFRDLPSFDTEKSRAGQALASFVRILLLNVKTRYLGQDGELRDLLRVLDQSGICPYNDDEEESPLVRALQENRRLFQEYPETMRWVIRTDQYMQHVARLTVTRAEGGNLARVMAVPLAYRFIVKYLLSAKRGGGFHFETTNELELATMLWRKVPMIRWDDLGEFLRTHTPDVDREQRPQFYRRIQRDIHKQRTKFQTIENLVRPRVE